MIVVNQLNTEASYPSPEAHDGLRDLRVHVDTHKTLQWSGIKWLRRLRKDTETPNSLRHTNFQEAIWNLSKHLPFGLPWNLPNIYMINRVTGCISCFSSNCDKIPQHKQLEERKVSFAVAHNLRIKSIMAEESRQHKFEVAGYMPLCLGRRKR